jgi:hypothetical protein
MIVGRTVSGTTAILRASTAALPRCGSRLKATFKLTAPVAVVRVRYISTVLVVLGMMRLVL